MAKPRIFISSTFYDLQHIRTSLEGFVERLGYEAVLSEKGRIAYDPDIPLDESCYRESAACDIFVLIIGGRSGSAASGEDVKGKPDFYERYQSITEKEYNSAYKRDIPIYILVERAVFSEYQTYKKNKGKQSMEYAHVDSVNIFHLLEKIVGKARNNPIHQFDRHTEIEEWLREQWAGLFKEFINRRSEQKQLSSLSDGIAELSSINSSLQRYMEAIVSDVSSPEDAKKLIDSEKERLEKEKALREFHTIGEVGYLKANDLPPDEIEKIFREADSLNNLAHRIEEAYGNPVAEEYIIYWKKNSKALAQVNQARSLLGKPPLEFENEKSSKKKKKP